MEHHPTEDTVDIVALLGLNGYSSNMWSEINMVAAYYQIPSWLGSALPSISLNSGIKSQTVVN